MKKLLVILLVIVLLIGGVLAVILADMNDPAQKEAMKQQLLEDMQEGELTLEDRMAILEQMAASSNGEADPRRKAYFERYEGEVNVVEKQTEQGMVTEEYRADGSLLCRHIFADNGDIINETYDTNSILRIKEEAIEGDFITTFYDENGVISMKDSILFGGEIVSSIYDENGTLIYEEK